MERYLRVLKYDQNETINDMSFQMCKFSLNDAKFLAYRPSQIAACACIISINVYEEDELKSNGYKKSQSSFFNGTPTPPSSREDKANHVEYLWLKTDIWNNEEVFNTTHYSFQDIKHCLKDLCDFISGSLSPNRLEAFYYKDIMEIENFT